MNPSSFVQSCIQNFRFCWKELAITDLAFKIISFILLTPLVGILFEIFLEYSGKTTLTDQELLFFLLGPLGWTCFILVGGIGLGIIALEQTSLLGILCFASHQKKIGVIPSLIFSGRNAYRVIRVTSRFLFYFILTLLPFLVIAGIVYQILLSRFDINFYLKEKPPEFMTALAIGGVLVLVLIVVLLKLITNWFLALPISVFEQTETKQSFVQSKERVNGHRKMILKYLLGWFLAMTILSSLLTSLLILIGQSVVPAFSGSLWKLATAIGICLTIWTIVNTILNLFFTTTFSTLLFQLYCDLGCGGKEVTIPAGFEEIGETGLSLKVLRKRLITILLVGIVIAVTVGIVTIMNVPFEDEVEVMAHRGASASAPENTMASVRKAIEDGADWVEIDVQETADGEIVVFHDSDFMKLSGVDLKIWDTKISDLEEIDIGSQFAPEFSSERVPTLDQVLKECKGKIGVNIELKYYGHDEKLEQRVIDIVEANEMSSNVVYMSLKKEAVEKMKSLRPECKAGLLMSVTAGNLGKINADFFAVNASFASRSFIRYVHGLNKEVFVWTVNDATSMSVMISRGVDSLITDKPALAKSVIQQREELTFPERILLGLAGTFGITPEIAEQ